MLLVDRLVHRAEVIEIEAESATGSAAFKELSASCIKQRRAKKHRAAFTGESHRRRMRVSLHRAWISPVNFIEPRGLPCDHQHQRLPGKGPRQRLHKRQRQSRRRRHQRDNLRPDRSPRLRRRHRAKRDGPLRDRRLEELGRRNSPSP